MSDNEVNNITITVAGRSYSLKIKAHEEQLIRGVAKEVNEKVAFFEKTYKQRDKKDCLSMALLTYAVEAAKLKQANNDTVIKEKVSRIEKLINETLINPK